MKEKKSQYRPSAIAALAAAVMLGQAPLISAEETVSKFAKPRERHPWDGVSLSKNERRGKTYEQIQALRQAKYEAAKKMAAAPKARNYLTDLKLEVVK